MKLTELYLDRPRLVNKILMALDSNIGDIDKFQPIFGDLIDVNADPEEISSWLYQLDDRQLRRIHRKIKEMNTGVY